VALLFGRMIEALLGWVRDPLPAYLGCVGTLVDLLQCSAVQCVGEPCAKSNVLNYHVPPLSHTGTAMCYGLQGYW